MKTILNTTFVVHTSIEPDFLHWVRTVYIPSVKASEIFGEPTIARVLTRLVPETESIAVQMTAEDKDAAERWHDETAALLKDDLSARWPNLALHFTTYMEVLDL